MRAYEIRQESDGFVFECIASPHEPMPDGWVYSFRLIRLTEQEAHCAGIFVRMNEDRPLGDLYELTEQHIGREPYGQIAGWKP